MSWSIEERRNFRRVVLAISLVALRISQRAADGKRTFGYHRFEILAAAFNALLLFGVAAYILYEAYRRWTQALSARDVIASKSTLADLAGATGTWLDSIGTADAGVLRGYWKYYLASTMRARGLHLPIPRLGRRTNIEEAYGNVEDEPDCDPVVVELFLKAGMNPNQVIVDQAREVSARTPLNLAVEIGDLNLVRLLVNNGAKIGFGDDRDETAQVVDELADVV